jgi:preprotein translocase subunit YajC
MLHLLIAQTQAASPAAANPMGGIVNLLPFVFIFVIFYYIMVRPQRRRQQEQQRLIAALKTGDRVVTASGIHGLISNVKETTVILKVADNVKIEIEKSAIGTVLKAEPAK